MNCDAKDLCDCAPLYEGWGGVAEWGEGDNDEKGIRVVEGDCDIGSKMAGAAQQADAEW